MRTSTAKGAASPNDTEYYSEVSHEQDGASDDADQGKGSRHQARLVEQESQQQVVYGRHKALSYEKDAII